MSIFSVCLFVAFLGLTFLGADCFCCLGFFGTIMDVVRNGLGQ